MTDRDRLIELLKDTPMLDVLYGQDEDWESAADYLLANGVIVPHCKVGDTVYIPIEKTSCVFETKILAIGIDEDGDFVLNPHEYPDDVFCVNGANIGKTVFLTKEEAEEKLKELNKNG